ncbi:MAG: protein kinase [Candidatus Zixiibacteriota bacterium]
MDQNHNTDDQTDSFAMWCAGATVAHYKIIQRIGAGGMGELFLAQDTRLDRLVALKTLAPKLAADNKARNRLLTEARAAARLSHPNICAIYAIEETSDAHFIAMEYVQGKTLREMADCAPVELAALIDVAMQCCLGLSVAHAGGVIHRDIKPSNIMIDRRGCVKLMDFGLATSISPESEDTTVRGTVPYMSPEQVTGKAVDTRSDIFSLGVVLYELTTGQRPFSGDFGASVAYAIVYEEPLPLVALRPEIPGVWRSIVQRAMQKDVERRYQSAEDMLTDLRSIQTVSSRVHTPPCEPVSVAVYPFRNMSDDPHIDYVADGLCDDIITLLTKIRRLNLPSRTAVFRLRERQRDAVQTARELMATNVLEGSIRQHGEIMRIHVRMVRAQDSFVVWSETYDRAMTDLLQLQADIAHRVVAALDFELTGDQERLITRKTRVNPDAYDRYLRGKHCLRKRTSTSVLEAIDLLEKATKLDPTFAAAHAELAVAYGLYHTYGFGQGAELPQQAFAAATRAVELDPASSEAHMSMVFALRNVSIKRTEAELRTAIALDPNNSEAHHYLAHALVLRGYYRAAESAEQIAIRLDPLNEISRAHLARICFFHGDLAKAMEQADNLLEYATGSHLAHFTKGWLYWSTRRWSDAVNCFELALSAGADDHYLADYLSDCYRRLKSYDKAIACLERGLQKNPAQHLLEARLGQVLAELGEKERAASHFDQARLLLQRESQAGLQPASALFQYDRAWLYALQNNAEESIHQLHLAVENDLGHYADLRTRPDWDSLRLHGQFTRLVDDLESRKRNEDRSVS